MINLLPPEAKKQIRAARFNVVLRNYIVMLTITGVLLAATFAIGFWVTINDKSLAETNKASSQAAAAEYQETRKAAEDFAKNLNTAQAILATNVSFSKLITDIATNVPSGVILSNLSLGGSTAAQNTPVEINAKARSYNDAVRLKDSLEASPIFENVRLTNITDTPPAQGGQGDPTAQRYPVNVTLNVQFTKNSGGS